MSNIRYVVLRKSASLGDAELMSLGPAMPSDAIEVALEDIPQSAAADLEADDRTIAAAPEMPVSLIHPTSNDSEGSGADDNWGLVDTSVLESPFDGAGSRVAVLDTGIDAAHPAFDGVNLIERDFTGSGGGDRNGHGTHCAGTIFGRDHGPRIGVARGLTEALIGKVLDDTGAGTTAMLLDAMQWAAREKAHVISMSLGFDFPRMVELLIADGWPAKIAASLGLEAYRKNLRLFDSMMDLFRAQRGIGQCPLVIAAAGNESLRDQNSRFRIAASLPAAGNDVVSVAALARTPGGLRVAPFSNTMASLSAPGVGILSAWPGNALQALDGTSMACPHVAGIAALWWQSLGNLANAETVASNLIAHASRDQLAAGYDHTDVGAGLVRAPT